MSREQSNRHSRIDQLTMYYLGQKDDDEPDDDEDDDISHDTPISVKSSSEEELDKQTLLEDERPDVHDPDDDGVFYNDDVQLKDGWRPFLEARGLWEAFVYMVTFAVHFVMVLGILTGGAVVFAYLEDGEYLVDGTNATDFSTTTSNDDVADEEYFKRLLWKEVESKFNISVTEDIQEPLIQHFREYVSDVKKRQEETSEQRQHFDKMFIFQKWLYFVTIATTTIGYGDLSPKTDDGKLFYIFFSIIGIILMMTLLRRCGTIISATNRLVYNLISTYLCRGKTDNETVSAILSLLTTLLIFGVYFFAGFWYGKEMLRESWTLLEQIYFWIVTLTTVGFGDLTLSIEEEVENMSFYLVYRLFGLAILAAIIDAIEEVAKAFDKKREKLKKRLNSIRKGQSPLSRNRKANGGK